MSIYIGNNSTEKVFHLYDGSTTIEKVPFSGTSFHSSLPYFRVVSRHRFTYNGTTPYAGTIGSTYSYTSRGYATTNPLPSTSVPYVIVGVKDGVTYFFPTAASGSPYFPAYTAGNSAANVPSFGLTSTSVGFTASSNSAIFSHFSVLVYDYIDVLVIGSQLNITPSDIVIDNSDIVINGDSIFDNEYIHELSTIGDRLNNYDLILAIPSGGTDIYTDAGNIYRPNYVTSSDMVSFTNNVSGGSYSLHQIINSASGDISGVRISSENNTISVVKNGVEHVLFDGSAVFKTLITNYSSIKIISSGQIATFSGSFLVKTLNINIANGDNLIVMYYTSGANPRSDAANLENISNGKTFIVYTAFFGFGYIKGVCDTINNQINFYWVVTNPAFSSGATVIWTSDIYVATNVIKG